MKIISILFFSALAFGDVRTIRWEIIGQESKLPVHHGTGKFAASASAGQVTVAILEAQKIPFVGNESGMNSILGTPTGDDAIVVVSDDTMRVYGWCYSVDGKDPDEMPDKFYFKQAESVLRWYYAFALYEAGQWKSYCTPASTLPRE